MEGEADGVTVAAMMKVSELRKMLDGLDGNAEIVIQSCCGGGCVLTANRVALWQEIDPGPDAGEILILVTDGSVSTPRT